MNNLAYIELYSLSWLLIPIIVVFGINYIWSIKIESSIYALFRMLLQLFVIGYFLTFMFELHNRWGILLLLCFMLIVASWIALGSVKERRSSLFLSGVISILAGGGSVLVVVLVGVLSIETILESRIIIPLAGMIFASSMNSVSLSVERFYAEVDNNPSFEQARNKAFQAAMIPTLNSLLAVGLVSLPGMMTGQILSGVSPFIAARYQVMVMAMIFSANGLSVAVFLHLIRNRFPKLVKN